MKIAVIQASSQKDKNPLLYQCTVQAVEKWGHQAVNFGVFPEEEANYSYIETALLVSLLLSGGAVDFVVTGCSSGQGMMLACNSLPGVLCGFAPTPQDAFLFGRINGGNAVSLPLGLGFGWCGELNMLYTLEKLFDGPFGGGYPAGDADRKRRDTRLLKELNRATKRGMEECFGQYPKELAEKVLGRRNVAEYIRAQGTPGFLERLFGGDGNDTAGST